MNILSVDESISAQRAAPNHTRLYMHCRHWSDSNSGGHMDTCRRREVVESGRRYPTPPGEVWERAWPLTRKMAYFGEFWAVFLSIPSPEKCWFSAWSGYLLDFKDVHCVLCSFGRDITYCHQTQLRQYPRLIHCNESSLVLEILKNDKSGGIICISDPLQTKFWGTHPITLWSTPMPTWL